VFKGLRNKSCAQKTDILHVKNTVCCRGLNDYLQYKIRSPVLHVSMSQPHIRLLQNDLYPKHLCSLLNTLFSQPSLHGSTTVRKKNVRCT